MTNHLVGDIYAKVIEEVVAASQNDFEESGVSIATLRELQQEWQTKLSQRGVAQMPWDPKPAPPPMQAPNPVAANYPSAVTNGLPPSYSYDGQANGGTSGPRVKSEFGAEQQYPGAPNGYPQNVPPTQGGLARAQQLVQQYNGQPANGPPMSNPRGGLALPGQQALPQGLQLPGQSQQQSQPYYPPQQQPQLQRQQPPQSQQQQPQPQPRIKIENSSPQIDQGSFQQQQPRQPNPTLTQTDGADDRLADWQAVLAERRAAHARNRHRADRLVHDQVMQVSSELQNGLMVPLAEQPTTPRGRQLKGSTKSTSVAGLSIPQLDGDLDDEDEKADIKDEEDENAINSDLDDSDEEGQGAMGDEDDDLGDSILCTYDKVQRVKNKWKCTLKDGVMSIGGKEWVFHKGTGEFEW